MRIVLSIFFLLFLNFLGVDSIAQTGNIDIKGQIEDQNTGAGIGGVTLELYKDGTLIETVTTASNGKYKFKKTPVGGVFTVKFSKAGYVGKYAELDTRGIEPEDARDLPLEVNSSIFEEVPGVDFSILDTKPVAKAKYSKDIDNMEWDMSYIEKTKKEVEKIIAKADEAKAATEKKFNDAVTAGNNAMANGDYATAVTKYNEALAVKNDEAIKLKVKEAEEKKIAAATNAQIDKTYNEQMAEAKKFFEAKDYASAKTKYQEASKTKPAEKAPQDKIKEIDALLQKQIEEDTKYNKFLTDGEKAMLAENYDEAIKQYTEANKLRPSEALPKEQIQKAKDAKAAKDKATAEEAKKKTDFDNFVKAGDKGVTDKKYDDAIANFDKALALFDDAAVKAKKEAAVKLRDADIAAKKEQEALEAEKKRKQEEFDALMKKGNGEMTAAEYESAIATFTSALTVIPKEPTAEAKLAEAKKKNDEKIAADKLAKEKAEKKEAFDKLIARGDTETGNAEYDKAIASFKEALVLIKDEPTAVAKLKDAETKKNNYVKNKTDFDNFVKAGDKGVTDKKYDEAIANFDKALALFDDAAVKAKKEAALKSRDADIAAQKEKEALEAEKKKKQEEFDALMKKGNGEMTATEYESAIATFTSALTVIPKEPTAEAKLAEAKKKNDEKIAADKLALEKQQKQEKFNELVQKGDNEVAGENYDAGIKAYEEALVIIPKDPGAEKKLADARTKKNNKDKENALAEENRLKQEKFDALVKQGDNEMGAASYDKAIATYTSALAVKDDAGVKAKIADAQNKKKEADLAAKNKEQQEEQFKKLYNEGMTASNQGDFDKAITNFEAALAIKKDDAGATAALETARKRKQENLDQIEKEYQNRLTVADKEFDAGNYAEAKKHYEKLNKLKPEDAHPKNRIPECDAKIKEKEQSDLAAAEKRKNYEAEKIKGDESYKASKWDEAITHYEKALTFLDETYAKDQIDLAKKKKEETALAAEQKKKRDAYDAAILKADQLFKAAKWDEAIAQYEVALTHLDEKYAKDQINFANENKQKALSQAEQEKQKRADFNALVQKGDGDVTNEDFDEAITAYEDALKLFKEPTVETKLANARTSKINKDKQLALESENKLKKEKYDQFMKKGNEDLWAEKFDDAIASYNSALAVFKDDPEAKAKIAEALEKKKKAQLDAEHDAQVLKQIDENFKKHYNSGMTFSNQGEFDKAITEFEAALEIKKNDPDATAALETARKRKQENLDQIEKEYQNRLTVADKEFDAGNYAEAKKHYEKLNKLKPEDAHPKNRIVECNNKLGDLAELEKLRKSFDATMANGNTELANKNFDKAISFYESAKIILPDEKTPDIKIAEAKRLKEEAEKEGAETAKRNKFTKLMNEGQEFMNKSDFDQAISKFEAALVVIPNEQTALDAIALAHERKKDLEREIEKILAFADKEFGDKNWTDAKKYYEKYLKFRKNDAYAISQIKKCQTELDLIDAAKGEASKYDKLLKAGNTLFGDKKYKESRQKFVEALNLMPNMSYPQKKIDEIDELLAQLEQAKLNEQNKKNNNTVTKKKEPNYGDRTTLSADDALALLLQNKLDDELDKYGKIKKAKEQMTDENVTAAENSQKERTDNFTTISGQKALQKDYSGNTDLLDSNTAEYRKMKEQLEAESKLWNADNDIKKQHKADIDKMYELYDMAKYEEKLRVINSEKINEDKDEVAAINKELDSKANTVREANGTELVKMKDLTHDQFSANGDQLIDKNGNAIQNEFDRLNNQNKIFNDQASTVRDQNAEDLKVTHEIFAQQNKVNQEKLLEENENTVQDAFINQHDVSYDINSKAATLRNDNSKDLNKRKDDFADQNKNISDELLRKNEDDIEARYDLLNEENKTIDALSASTRNENSKELIFQRDVFAETQNYNQEVILDANSDRFVAMHESAKDKNDEMNATAANVRNKNGDDLVAKKDLLQNSTAATEEKLLTENGAEIKTEYDALNERNKDINEKSSVVRDANGDELKQQKDEIKAMNDKGATSPAENVKKLKAAQDAMADQQKKTDAANDKKHQATKDELTKKAEAGMVFEKGEEGYQSQYTKDFPQGITEEVYTRKDADGNVTEVTVRRIVVKGEYGNEYRKVVTKTGTYYFKNGKTITNLVWDLETS